MTLGEIVLAAGVLVFAAAIGATLGVWWRG